MGRMRDKWIGAGVLALLLLLVIGYPLIREGNDDDRLSVRLGAAEDLINSLVWIAADQGFFEARGVDVRLQEYRSGKRALRGLLEGRVELVTTSEVPFMKALQEHPDLRLLATVGTTDNEIHVVARRDRGISEPKDLVGRRIGTQRASAVHFFLSSFLLQHYIPASAVELRFMRAEQLPGALAAGEIDAFSMREPYIHQARQLLGERLVLFSEPGLYRKTFNLVATREFAAANPELLRRFLAGLLQAENFVYRHPERAQRILARIRGLTPGEVAAVWDSYTFSVLLDQDLLLQLQQEEQWLESELGIPRQRRPLSSYVDQEPMRRVAPERNGIIAEG
ncbi:MAG TPA: hypothetical protein ENI96_03790 [Sedimenticola thiotaurini]|uniref:SsuA/THI5-like domain-containing protein n=1 Tax=Sedimenticola thiotaurini TaxID=1543721 RepID=A0A831W4G7_9GAMM|nr:hypothetical protein [Sedimenticola thiotaurini]